MENKFGPSSLITIESSGYARPFDRMPVEEHTCRHPRRDVEGLVTASLQSLSLAATPGPFDMLEPLGGKGKPLGGYCLRRQHRPRRLIGL